MYKHVIYIVLCLFLLGGCRQKKTFFIAVSQCSEDSWRTKMNSEIKREAYLYDNVRLKFASAKDDNAVQIQQIEQFIDEGADLLIVSPNEAKALTPVINKAFDKGVHVVLVDRKSASDKYTAFIGADNVAIGRAVGQYVGKRLQGKGKVFQVQGLEGSSPAVERDRGFRQALQQYPDIEIVADTYADWFAYKAKAKSEECFGKMNDIDLVFAQCDRMGLGVYQAMQERGLKDIKIVGIDALPTPGEGIEAVSEGHFLATFIYPTHGDEVLQLAMKILEGKPFQRETILETGVVDHENATIMLQQSNELMRLDAKMEGLSNRIDTSLAQYNNQKIILLLFILLVAILIISAFFLLRAYFAKVRLNDRLEEKNREIEEVTQAKLVFFTNVSHELRTPLTLIAAPIEQLLQDTRLQTQHQQLLSMAHRNVNTLLKLINQLLDFRKVENGKMTINLSSFPLIPLIHTVVAEFTTTMAQRHITLSLHLDNDEMSVNLVADREKIERVLANIISNAVKYTPNGGKIEIELTHDKEENCCTICVKDSGQGIAEKDLPHVFERFYQSTNSKTGTGIGLALSKNYIDMHGGQITAESKVGEGATFTVILPLQQATPTASPTELITAQAHANVPVDVKQTPPKTVEDENKHLVNLEEEESETRRTLLVVDDNEDVCQLIKTILSPHYTILLAKDGRQGLQECGKYIPDLVISDVMMPVMDGMEFCRQLKTQTATSHIPVILLTARTMEEQRIEAYEHGADGYLTKPFTPSLLEARVSNLLDNRHRLKQVFGSKDQLEDENISHPDKEFIAKIRSEIQRNIDDADFNVERLGESVGLSRVQLYRKVKALTGYSPVELIRITRLNQAHKLLANGQLTISEVAYQVGFTSPSYFTKCFKEQFGTSPNEVKR